MNLLRSSRFLRDHPFPRFVLVGAVGFLTDAGLMSLLHYRCGFGIVTARLCSFSIAVTVTWLLNRKLTFHHTATSRPFSEWGRYTSVGVAGGLLNLGIFLGLTRWVSGPAGAPLPALAIAAAITLLFTYSGSRLLVFTGTRRLDSHDSP